MERLWPVVCCALVLLTAEARAEDLIEPGEWKVTTNTTMNGAMMPPQVKSRCLTADQTADVGRTFGPVFGTVNSSCQNPEQETGGRRLKWRLQCKGQIDMDISGDFIFDSSAHYSGTIVTKAWMAGALTSDVKSELQGERVGACTQ